MSMKKEKYKLAVLLSHPTQYHSPFFEELSKNKRIDLTVYYCCRFGVEKRFDPCFGKVFAWDIPLLQGYQYRFLSNLSPLNRPSFFGLINPGIIRELLREKYDAILIYGYASISNIFALIGGRFSGTRIFLRGAAILDVGRPLWLRIIKKLLLTSLFKKIDVVLFDCNSNKKYYKSYKVQESKLIFVPCSVDNNFCRRKARELCLRKSELRKRFNIPTSGHVILFSGKLMKIKCPMDLLRAFETIPQYMKAILVFVGDGPEREILQDYPRRRGIKNVYFAGFKNQNELMEFYAMADVLVLPSSRDRSPKVVNEAMNFGLPVIVTSSVGTAGDLIEHNKNGFIYNTGDITTLSEYLQRLINDEKLRDRMKKEALNKISFWSYKNGVKNILNAILTLTIVIIAWFCNASDGNAQFRLKHHNVLVQRILYNSTFWDRVAVNS